MPQPADFEIDLPSFDQVPTPAAAPTPAPVTPAVAAQPRKPAAPRKPRVATVAAPAPAAPVAPSAVTPRMVPVTIDVKAPAPPPRFEIAAPKQMPELPASVRGEAAIPTTAVAPSEEVGAGAAVQAPALAGKEQLSGKQFAQDNRAVEMWHQEMARLARAQAKAGKPVDMDDIKRKAAVVVYGQTRTAEEAMKQGLGAQASSVKAMTEYLPEVDVNLSGLATNVAARTIGLPAWLAGGAGVDIKLPDVTKEAIQKKIGIDEETALKAILEKEKRVKDVTGVSDDPLVRKARAEAERFETVGKRQAPHKLVNDFIRRYTDYLMVQGGKDNLKNTDPLAYEKARKDAELDAREVALKLRVSGDPVFTAGYGVVTTDDVKKAFKEEGVAAGLMKAGSVLLPQQIVSRTGETVRTESIPSTLMRGIGIGNAILASQVKVPGSPAIDPLAAVQRGEMMMTLALDNDQIGRLMKSDNELERAEGYIAVATALAADILVPGAEVVAAPAAVKSAQVAGRAADITHELVNGMRLADMAGEDVATAARLSYSRIKAATEINAISRNPAELVGNIVARNATEPMSPTAIKLAFKQRSPGLAYIYETGVASRLEGAEGGRDVLNAIDDLGIMPNVRTNLMEKVQDGNAIAGLARARAAEFEADVTDLSAKLAQKEEQAAQAARAGDEAATRKLAAEAKDITRDLDAAQAKLESARSLVDVDVPAMLKRAADEELASMMRRSQLDEGERVLAPGKLEAKKPPQPKVAPTKPMPTTRQELAQELAGQSAKSASLTSTARYASILKDIVSRDPAAAMTAERLRAAGTDHPIDILKGMLKAAEERAGVDVSALEQSIRKSDIDLAAARTDLEMARRALGEPDSTMVEEVTQRIVRVSPDEATVPAFMAQPDSPYRAADIAADGVRSGLREKITDPDILKQVEMRYGTDRSQPFAFGGEPFERPDRLVEPRPSVNLQGVKDPNHLYDLARRRAYSNVWTYLVGSDPVGLKNLTDAAAKARAAGGPSDIAFAEEAERFINEGSKRIDQASKEFAERMGLPHYPQRKTFNAWTKADADAFYAALDARAAAMPGVPRARSENAYLRWSAARSAPDGVAPEVIRYDDLVSFNDRFAVQQAGPLTQRVVMPDNSITEKAVIGDWANGKVVWTGTLEGERWALVQPVEYVGGGNRYTLVTDRKPIAVPIDNLEFRERGRVQDIWFGRGKTDKNAPYGRTFSMDPKSPRPMLAEEWDALAKAEKDAGMEQMTYSRRGNDILYTELAPPKRPTETDFDLLDIPPGELRKRGVAIPRYERPMTEAERRSLEVTTELPRGQKAISRMEQDVAAADALVKKLEGERAKIEAALKTKKGETVQASSIRKALDEALSDEDLSIELVEDVGATQVSDMRPEVSLKREVKEVNKLLANSLRRSTSGLTTKIENAFVNTYEYWGMRNSSARVVAERSLTAVGRDVTQYIREQSGEASGLILRTTQGSRSAVSPDERFNAMLELIGDKHSYGHAWKLSQESGSLNGAVVRSIALSYFENPDAIVNQAPELVKQLEEAVKVWDGDAPSLADHILEMSRSSIDKSDVLVEHAPAGAKLQVANGDYQFTASVMAQSVVDNSLQKASNVGLMFSSDQARKMMAGFQPMMGNSSRIVTDAERAEGRRLALLSLETAVDHQRPLTQPYAFGEESVLKSGNIDRPSIVSAAKYVGKLDEVESAATEGEAAMALIDGASEMYRGNVYIPDAIKQELDRATQQLITASRAGAQSTLAGTFKQHKIYGLFAPRTKFYLDQVTQESDNIAAAIGLSAAVKSGINAIVPTMFAAPGVSAVTGFVDLVRGLRGGTTATESLAKVQDVIAMAPFGYETSRAMGASTDAIDGMMGVTYADLNRIGLGRGVQNAPQSTDLNRSLAEAFREPITRLFAQPTLRRVADVGAGALSTITVDVTKEIGTAITERRRWGTMMMLFEQRVAQLRAEGKLTKESVLAAADEAARGSVEIHMDYSATMHPVEKNWVESMFFPFWSFEKSNMIRIARQIGTRGERFVGALKAAREGYRLGRWTRSKRDAVELVSFMLDPADIYGFDQEAMQDDDEATAQSMRKEGKSEEEIQAAMLYPQYKAIVQQAEATGIEPWQVRHNLSWDTDVRLNVFAPFLDYYNAPPPRSLVPDKYSETKAVFPIIQADSKLRSVRSYDDMMNPKTAMGPNRSYTMWMLPEDSNLAIFSRAIALESVVTSFTANGLSDPTARQRAWGSLFDLTGDPFGFNPMGNALGNALLASLDVNKTTTQPIKIDDASGEVLMKLMPDGAITRVNQRTKWTMLDQDGGTVEVDADEGYYVSPQTAPMLGIALISYLDATGQVERMSELVTGLSMSMDDATRDEGVRRISKSFGAAAKKVDVTKQEASQAQVSHGLMARMPNVPPAAYTEVTQTIAGAALEQYQRGEQELAGPAGSDARTRTLLNFGGKDADITMGSPGTARVLLKDLGVLTEEQAKSAANEDIIKASADPRVRAAARQAGQAAIESLPDQRAAAIEVKRIIRAVAGGYAKPEDLAKMRYILVASGSDPAAVDAMSGDDIIRSIARSNQP